MARALPKNTEAEKAVIAAALCDEFNAKTIVMRLEEDDFSKSSYKYIFTAIKTLYDNKMSLDVKNVVAVLEDNKHLEDVGGIEGLSDIMNSYISNEGLEDLCNVLLDKKNVRAVLLKMHELENNYYAAKYKDDLDFLGRCEVDIRQITGNRRAEGFKDLKTTAAEVRQIIEEARNRGNELVGVDTGYKGLNLFTLGFSAGEFIVIAARPSVGKTALALNIGLNVAQKEKKPVLFFSLEMSEVDLGKRVLSRLSQVDSKKIQTGRVSDDDMVNVENGIAIMKRLPVYIDPTGGIKINDLIAKTRKFKIEHPDLQMVIIDYLGLIAPDRNYENLRIQIGHICHALKNMAKELKLPVVVLSQLRRAAEAGSDKRPEMSDLRESGDIEQDADKVLLLYRDDYYIKANRLKSFEDAKKGETGNGINLNNLDENKPSPADNAGNAVNRDPSMVECIVAKNRNGETGTAYLWFFKARSQFSDPTIESIQQYKAEHKIND